MTSTATIIPLFVFAPLAAAFSNALCCRQAPRISDLLVNLTTLSLFSLSLLAVAFIQSDSPLVYQLGGWTLPIGISLVVDGLTALLLITVNLVTFLITIYACPYMRRYTSQPLFNTLLLLLLAGMNGVLVAGDLFNLFVFLEIASVASFALVAFGTERHELEAAFKYAVMATVASLFILLGIVLLYGLTSTLNMADMSRQLAMHEDTELVLMVSLLFLVGFGLKAALVPFHTWLPDAHPVAPAPISALLSGVLIKSLGIYAICRVFYNVIGFSSQLSSLLLFLGALSMMVGVLLALGQRDLKRLLAYSSISQMGYIVFGLGLGTPLGILGSVFHLFNHATAKATLFLGSGATEYATGTRDLAALGGLAKRMPMTSISSFFAAMSIAGLPPFGGFWSKLIIIFAAVEAAHYGYALWATIVSILTLALFAKVMQQVFLGALPVRLEAVREVPWAMQSAMLVLAMICLLSGVLLLPHLKAVLLNPAVAVFNLGTGYADLIIGKT